MINLKFYNIIDPIFITISKNSDLKSGDFTPSQEYRLENLINQLLSTNAKKDYSYLLKEQNELEKLSAQLIRKVTKLEKVKVGNNIVKVQEQLISLFNEYISQNQ